MKSQPTKKPKTIILIIRRSKLRTYSLTCFETGVILTILAAPGDPYQDLNGLSQIVSPDSLLIQLQHQNHEAVDFGPFWQRFSKIEEIAKAVN